ncbi:protein LTO1 homolog isoform X2 [Budorcas taxicolor]|uniref:protein LTO1 homolog isoform X2 n=1 Tax=Budorcas taxicolor TaxID=37181 RepID=UPI0022838FCF|nr:protein LTO1 homolog isoform X2 [Budorcas taxicolor]
MALLLAWLLRFHGEGYREGYEAGSSLGMIEGRRHGTLHGAKVGSERSWGSVVQEQLSRVVLAQGPLMLELRVSHSKACLGPEEIGCYQGFAFAWRGLLHGCATERDSKKMKVLEALIGMIQKFPYDDPTYDKLHEDLDRIRGKFKQLCSLLNVQPDFKISAEGSGLSF